MSRIRANTIVNGAGTGAPNFPRGAIISGISTITADIDAGNIDIGTGTSLSSPGSNELAVGTNNLERLRITSAGNIGIGTDNPDNKLHLYGASNVDQRITCTGNDIINLFVNSNRSSANDTLFAIKGEWNGTQVANIKFNVGDDTTNKDDGYITFNTRESGTGSSSERLRITSGGEVQIANGNLKFSTAGTGIDFSATSDGSGGTTTSEILTEYEEGTFTPKYITTTGGDAGITMLTQNGTYTRIGNLVYIQLTLATSDWSTGVSGDIRIADLPYALNDANTNVGSFNFSFRREWATDIGANMTARFVNSAGIPYIYFYKNATNSSGSTNLNAADFLDGGSENYIYGSGIYALL